MEKTFETRAETVDAAVKALFGEKVQVAGRRSIGGGCINKAAELTLSDGKKLFVKENSGRYKDMFLREAEGLLALRAEGGPTVPRPLACHGGGQTQFILMEFVTAGARKKTFWEDFGRGLAALHKKKNDTFGFSADNFIGATVQVNTSEKRWSDFFGRHRLLFQANLAVAHRKADKTFLKAIEKLCEKLSLMLPEPKAPALLHGDLWSGNYMVGGHGEPVLIDPAVYYGHPEADLAMTELFGKMNDRFYASYHEVSPIDDGYRERRDLYNLYHLLNHLNLFGYSYYDSALAVVRRYL